MSDTKDLILLLSLLNKQGNARPFNINELIIPAMIVMIVFYLLITKTQTPSPEIRYVQASQPIQYNQQHQKIKYIPKPKHQNKQFDEIHPFDPYSRF